MKKSILKKYPKFLLLVLTFIVAYLLFYGRTYKPFNDFMISLDYSGTFVAGALFAYGFTAAPATALMLILAKEQNIYLAGLLGGLGALLSDLFILSFIRHSFADEIRKLSREKAVIYIGNITPSPIKRYLALVLAGFIIASPLPDEIGVTLLSISKTVSVKAFSVISYILNTAGIFLIFYIGNLI